MGMSLIAFVKKGRKEYVALCLELDVVSSGRTIHEAVENLTDAVREFLEYVHEEGLAHEVLPRPVDVTALREFLACAPVYGECQEGWGVGGEAADDAGDAASSDAMATGECVRYYIGRCFTGEEVCACVFFARSQRGTTWEKTGVGGRIPGDGTGGS